MTGDGFKKMVEIQSLLCYGAYATDRSSIKRGAFNRLKRIWLEVRLAFTGISSELFFHLVYRSLLLKVKDYNTIHCNCYVICNCLWCQVPGSAEKYATTVCKLEPSVCTMCMVSYLMQFWAITKQMELLNKHKDDLIDLYLKNIIGARSKTAPHLLVGNCVKITTMHIMQYY